MENNVSNQQLYELVNNTRRELSDDIKRLDDRFTMFEAGRLTDLERDVANFKGRFSVVMIIISTLIAGLVSYFIAGR